MKPWIRYALLGLAAYLAFLVVFVPAHWVAAHLPAEIRLHGVSGTPWRGHARRIEYAGYAVERVDWWFKAPYRILWGELPWRVRIERGAVSGFTDLVVSPRALSLGETDLNLNLRLIEDAVAGIGVRLGGEPVHLQAEVLELRRGGPGAARGSARWEGAALRAPVALALGTLKLHLADDEAGWLGRISNDSDRIRIEGTVRLAEGWAWSSEIRLSPGPAAEPALRQALPLLGTPDRSGTVLLRGSGRLAGAGGG